jgi:hypothetical protein
MNPDFSLFFMIKRAKSHSNTAANKINSTGKMISCIDISRMFCEYMNRTGNNENRKG